MNFGWHGHGQSRVWPIYKYVFHAVIIGATCHISRGLLASQNFYLFQFLIICHTSGIFGHEFIERNVSLWPCSSKYGRPMSANMNSCSISITHAERIITTSSVNYVAIPVASWVTGNLVACYVPDHKFTKWTSVSVSELSVSDRHGQIRI